MSHSNAFLLTLILANSYATTNIQGNQNNQRTIENKSKYKSTYVLI